MDPQYEIGRCSLTILHLTFLTGINHEHTQHPDCPYLITVTMLRLRMVGV